MKIKLQEISGEELDTLFINFFNENKSILKEFISKASRGKANSIDYVLKFKFKLFNVSQPHLLFTQNFIWETQEEKVYWRKATLRWIDFLLKNLSIPKQTKSDILEVQEQFSKFVEEIEGND